MRKICLVILLFLTLLGLNNCGLIKSEIQASKNKKNLDQTEKRDYYLLTLFGTHSEVKHYLLKQTKKERENFLKSFWMMYDPDLSTSRNSFYVKVLKRYSYAKLKYKHMLTSGEYTDMGRIYIKYGPPDEMNVNPIGYDRQDYETIVVWKYNEPKVFTVVFKDSKGDGEYRLLTNESDFPPVTSHYFRVRSLKEVLEWRKNHEK